MSPQGATGAAQRRPWHFRELSGQDTNSSRTARRGGLLDSFHVLGRPVRVDDAEEPQRPAAELQRHSDDGADRREGQVEPEELQPSDSKQVGQAFHVVTEVKMPAARDY